MPEARSDERFAPARAWLKARSGDFGSKAWQSRAAEYQIDIARQLNLPKLRQLITSGSRRVSEEAMWMVMVLAQNGARRPSRGSGTVGMHMYGYRWRVRHVITAVVNRPRMIDAQFDQLFRTMAENPKLSGPLRESAEELDKRIFRACPMPHAPAPLPPLPPLPPHAPPYVACLPLRVVLCMVYAVSCMVSASVSAVSGAE